MVKAAIFDLDGTLLDTTGMWETLGERFLGTLNITPERALRDIIWDMTLPQSAAFFRNEYRLELSEGEILRRLLLLTEDVYTNSAPLKVGAEQLLGLLRARNVRAVIATAADAGLAERALTRTGIFGNFSGIFSCSEYGAKSSPQIFLKCAEFLAEEPAETVVFEDSLTAVLTAKGAGFITAAVSDDSENDPDSLRGAADFYGENLDVLAAAISEILPKQRR